MTSILSILCSHICCDSVVYIVLPFLLTSVDFMVAQGSARQRLYLNSIVYYINLMNSLQDSHQMVSYVAETVQVLARTMGDAM
jgi:uncharacterized membrane protein